MTAFYAAPAVVVVAAAPLAVKTSPATRARPRTHGVPASTTTVRPCCRGSEMGSRRPKGQGQAAEPVQPDPCCFDGTQRRVMGVACGPYALPAPET